MSTPYSSSEPAHSPPLTGLVAATYTPYLPNGEVNFEMIPRLVDHLARNEVAGMYICGSTGEGPSLTMEERTAVGEAYVKANRGRLRTIVHVGHTCLADSQKLAEHATSIGADAISAIAPYYFKPDTVETLIAYFKEVAASAPTLPFYYYHIPALTGLVVDPAVFLQQAEKAIPNLRGIKFTDKDLSLFNACQDVHEGRFDILFGRDEMLLSGLAAGTNGAVGTTYNYAPKLYMKVIRAFKAGDIEEARKWQRIAVRTIHALINVGGPAALKYPMQRLGLDCGQSRLPMKQLTSGEMKAIDDHLEALGFDEWATRKNGENV